MAYLYYGSSLVALGLYLRVSLRDMRQSLLAGLTFTSWTLAAGPWEVVPLNGVALGTHLLFCLLVVTYALARRSIPEAFLLNRYNLGVILLAAVMLAYITIAENVEYGMSKTLFFVLRGIVPVLAIGTLAPLRERDLRTIARTAIAGAVLMMIKLYALGDINIARATIVGESSPITVARTLGVGATMLGYYVIHDMRLSSLRRFAAVVIFGVIIVTMLSTGTRGPLLGVVASITGLLVFPFGSVQGRQRKLTRVALLGSLLLVGAWAMWSDAGVSPGFQRVVTYMSTIGENTSDQGRIERYRTAAAGFVESAGLGVGTGDFAALHGLVGRQYPHNLVLEVLAEQGILGGIVLLYSLWVPFSAIVSGRRDGDAGEWLSLLGAVWVFGLVNAFLSTDIAGDYILWVSGGLVSYVAQATRKGTGIESGTRG